MKTMRIFLTGGTSGIGAATARALAEAGHKVFAVGRREDKLAALPEGVLTAVCDVLDPASVETSVRSALDALGGIDVCIPNAGVGHFDALKDGKLEEWHHMVDLNIKGVLTTIHACLPHLVESKGHVINIGSLAARNVFPNSGVYCATKHAVLALSESLRIEFRETLAVTTINPGAVRTEFIQHTSNNSLREAYEPQFDEGMSADTIAEAILVAIEARGKAVFSEITLRPDRR